MKIVLLALVKVCLCIVFGAGFGWFVSNEWQKHNHKEGGKKQVVIVETKAASSNDDVPILDWRGK